MNIAVKPNHNIPDPWSLPLDTLDPSRAELFEHNVHLPYFRRLRQKLWSGQA